MNIPEVRRSNALPQSAFAPVPAASPAAAPDDAAILGSAPEPAAGLIPRSLVQSDQAEPGKPQYLPGQVLVKFTPGLREGDMNAFFAKRGLSVIRHFDVPPQMRKVFGGELYQLKLRAGETVQEAIARLSGQPGVVYAEPNYRIQLNDPPPTKQAPAPQPPPPPPPPNPDMPNDMDPRLWGIYNTGQDGGKAGEDVNAAAAWKTEKGNPNGQGPLVCIIDTGMDYNHNDLKANVWTNPGEIPGNGKDDDGDGIIDDIHGANLITKTGDPMDDNDHGTHCAGTIGAVGNNGAGIVGVNWNATIASAKFLDAGGSGSLADAVDAVLYATRIGARVTSNSWGGGGFSQALYDAFKASPALHIVAAGNDGQNTDANPAYPASFDLDNIVSVAAYDRTGHLADFSNYGPTTVDVAAPGVDIYSLKPGNSFQTMSGTSMATPHTTGVVGLILSRYPGLSNAQVKARLINGATREPEFAGKMVSGGRVNAASALKDDSIPPATPGDFHVAQAGATDMTLGWTAVGDDGTAGGPAASYELRYASQPIGDRATETTTAWADATPVPALPAPGAPGAAESVRVAIEPDGKPEHYYFALKVNDAVGNPSGLARADGSSQAAAVPFFDDMESDNQNWTPDKPWGKVTVDGHGKVYTDSPNGPYDSNANTSLTSRSIDLSGVRNPRLLFKLKVDTEKGYDFGHVEVSADGGKTWDELARYDGTADWSEKNLDLKAYEGKPIEVRFRLTSDASINKDGIYVDDVKVAGDPKTAA